MASIGLERVRKVYGPGQVAVDGLSLDVSDGELVVLVGPSGSGKSTVLRLVAGLDPVTTGRVRIGTRDVTDVPPQDRDLAMVFQSYALYPHKTVRDNLTFGLRVRGLDRTTIDTRVRRAAESLGITPLLDRRPAQLSGGERQRVALGRAIVREPQGFLLDEPLSNLDPRLRVATRAEIALLHQRLAVTMRYVTHDQEEAMTLGDRIAVMRHGRIEQIGQPMEVFERPATTFVAEFIGTPAMNLIPAHRLPELAPGRGAVPAAVLGIRPHDIDMSSVTEADIVGRVAVRELLGATMVLHVRADAMPEPLVRVAMAAGAAEALDTPVGLRLRRDRVHRFDDAGRRLE